MLHTHRFSRKCGGRITRRPASATILKAFSCMRGDRNLRSLQVWVFMWGHTVWTLINSVHKPATTHTRWDHWNRKDNFWELLDFQKFRYEIENMTAHMRTSFGCAHAKHRICQQWMAGWQHEKSHRRFGIYKESMVNGAKLLRAINNKTAVHRPNSCSAFYWILA